MYDASCQWYLAVKKELIDLGMKSLSGDDAVFHLIKNNKLFGMCALYVDDFLTGGTDEFETILDEKLQGRFTFGKIKLNKERKMTAYMLTRLITSEV